MNKQRRAPELIDVPGKVVQETGGSMGVDSHNPGYRVSARDAYACLPGVYEGEAGRDPPTHLPGKRR